MSSSVYKTLAIAVVALPPMIAIAHVLYNVQHGLQSPRSFLLLQSILTIVYWYTLKLIVLPYFKSPLLKLAQPPGGSLVWGQAAAAPGCPRGETFREWLDTVPNTGLVYFRTLFHGHPNLLVTSTKGLSEVLVTKAYDFEKPPLDRKLLTRTVGHGLITVEGAAHKQQRKAVTPAFSGKHVNDLVPVFWSRAQAFATVIAEHLDVPCSSDDNKGRTGVVEIGEWASRVTLDIIGQACVGRDFGALYNSNDEFVQHYDKILASQHGSEILFALFTLLLPLSIARWTPFYTSFRQASEGRSQLRLLCRRLVKIKRMEMEDQSEKHIDILSVLIRSGQFDDDGLVEQLLTFLAAGHETTSNALTWTTHLLATHPSVQDKLRAELQSHFSQNPEINNASLDTLPYLNAVISEQLRLFPVVPIATRENVRETTILGQRIPKRTQFLISPWAINRSKAHWGPEAEDFWPERWLSKGEEGSRRLFSLITFLHGPRSCIGQAFSRSELKCLVAALIIKFKIEMADPSEVVEVGGFVTIKPKNGMRLRLTEL